MCVSFLSDAHFLRDFTQDNVATVDGAAQIAPYGGLPSPPTSPSHQRLDLRQPLNPGSAGKGPQAVQPDSGNDGPSKDTVVLHAGLKTPGPPPNYDEDPLAEFYAQARAERDAEVG